jgi:hypothetical protein
MTSSRRRASSDAASAPRCSLKAACVCAKSAFRRSFSSRSAAMLMRYFEHIAAARATFK